jgi:hypothetical protein
MPKRSSIIGNPQDENQLAKSIVDELTIEEDEQEPKQEKNAAAVALGHLGGLKGGKARAEKLLREQCKEIAKKAAKVRWASQKDKSS